MLAEKSAVEMLTVGFSSVNVGFSPKLNGTAKPMHEYPELERHVVIATLIRRPCKAHSQGGPYRI